MDRLSGLVNEHRQKTSNNITTSLCIQSCVDIVLELLYRIELVKALDLLLLVLLLLLLVDLL